jgi:hypothetical protein
MKTAEGTSPIRIESARRYVDGGSRRWGVVLLYPDQLASVNVRAEIAGALTSHGREVGATPLGLAVTPQAVGNGA